MVDTVQGVVMVLDSVFPSLGGGGAEAQVATLGRWLTDRGVSTTVVVPMLSSGPQQRHDVVGGVPVIRIAYPKWRLIGSLLLLLQLIWLLVANRHRITAIHAHIGNNMAAAATLTGVLLGKPVIVKMTGMTEMCGGVLDPKAGLFARFKRRILHRATAVQATSREIADLLVLCGFHPDRVHRIPNAVDVQRFNPAQRAEGRDAEPLTAIYVGRLEPEKGVALLIEAWHQAFGASPDVRLVLVGSGSLDGMLKARVAALGLGATVHFAGQSPTVERFLNRADFGVLASHAEGLSNTMLETLAAGLPMVASRVSGADDFIEHGVNGWLFAPGDQQALANRLRDAQQAGQAGLRRMGDIARERVVSQASMTAIGKRLMALYGLKSTCRTLVDAAPAAEADTVTADRH